MRTELPDKHSDRPFLVTSYHRNALNGREHSESSSIEAGGMMTRKEVKAVRYGFGA
jgi:hypothetical protein